MTVFSRLLMIQVAAASNLRGLREEVEELSVPSVAESSTTANETTVLPGNVQSTEEVTVDQIPERLDEEGNEVEKDGEGDELSEQSVEDALATTVAESSTTANETTVLPGNVQSTEEDDEDDKENHKDNDSDDDDSDDE